MWNNIIVVIFLVGFFFLMWVEVVGSMMLSILDYLGVIIVFKLRVWSVLSNLNGIII